MPEKNPWSKYRDELATQVKNFPKEERREFIEEAKNNPEYWAARIEKMEALYPYEPTLSAYTTETVEKYSEGQRKAYRTAGEQEKNTSITDIPTEGVVRALSTHLAEVPNARVVDVGSGERVDYLEKWREASPNVSVVIGIEPSEAMRERAEAIPHSDVIQLQGGDWLNTRLPRESIDMVVGRYSFHHVQDINAAYTELARILKSPKVSSDGKETPGGKAVIEIPHPDADKAILEKEIVDGTRPAGHILDGTPITKSILGAQIHSFYHSMDTYLKSSIFQEHFKLVDTRAGNWMKGTWNLQEGEIPNALELVIEKVK